MAEHKVARFMNLWRIMPDSWQATTIRRVGSKIMHLAENDQKFLEAVEKHEKLGSIEKVEKDINHIIADEAKELEGIVEVEREEMVLEFHETKKLTSIRREIVRLGSKVSIDKIRPINDAINSMISKLEAIQIKQMRKFDQMKSDDTIWTRTIGMDEASVIQEMRSIGRIERKLVRRIRRVENQISKILLALEKGVKQSKMDSMFNKLLSYTKQLEPRIDDEVRYFDELGRDEMTFMIFLRQKLRKLEQRVKDYLTKGFPEGDANKLIGKIEKIFKDEIANLSDFVADLGVAVSQAKR